MTVDGGSGLDLSQRPSSRTRTDRAMTAVMLVCLLAVVVPLAAVVYTLLKNGAGQLSAEFFTADIPTISRIEGPGMGPAIVGTLLITAVAAAMALPLGILGAIYLNESSAGGRLGRLIRFMATVMTGVPSVVMGLFVYVTYTLRFKQNAFGGALALAFLMLPVVIRTTEEMLKLVPDNLREASAALGARRSRTVLTVVLPAALPGVVSGCLLAVARAAGETAPILFVVGAATSVNTNVFREVNTALSAQIFANAQLPFEGAQQRAWGAALTLVLLAFVITLIARVVTARFALKR
ncbi:MAG: phosphate ABC transporter permease PstA [Actinobacteria bacterium]|nr:phosphate ABC transporter permease PstA [Actinomycetota bacterium]